MSVSSLRVTAVAICALLALAGCQTTAEPEPPTEPTTTPAEPPPQPEAPARAPVEEEPSWTTTADGNPIPPGESEPLGTTFYFDFDKAVVKARARSLLAEHARYLKENSGVDVVLEGHADERGTREYNLALGERRASAVESYLVSLGVPRSQLSIVSYGEERPVDPRSTEEAWAKNRRVEMVYR